MPPKVKEGAGKATALDPGEAEIEQKYMMESELVMAVLRSRLGRWAHTYTHMCGPPVMAFDPHTASWHNTKQL